MNPLMHKLIDALVYFVRSSSIDRKIIGGLYDTIKITTPLATKVSTVVENVSLDNNKTSRENVREREATRRAKFDAMVEMQKLSIDRAEIELKAKTIPLLERELEIRRQADSQARIISIFDEKRATLHAKLDSVIANKPEGDKK
jgi:hypothetical protein